MHQATLPRGQLELLRRDQVGARVTRVRVRRRRQVGVEQADRNVHGVSLSSSRAGRNGRTHPAILPCPAHETRRTLPTVTPLESGRTARYAERLTVPWW